jgi:hypothetical protein
MDLQIAASVLGDLYADLREHLPIDNSLAGDMYGWKPPLLENPAYSEIRALNKNGLHEEAFEKWHTFATGVYNRERLEALCQCLRKAGAGAKAKLIQVATMIERELKKYKVSSAKPPSSDRKRSPGPVSSSSAKKRSSNTGCTPPNKKQSLVNDSSEADSDSHQSLKDSPSEVENNQTSSMSKGNSRCTSRVERRKTSLSDITAFDVVQKVGKEWLINKMKAFLTDHRAVLLEGRHLINPTCKESIRAKLKLGDRSGAATEVVEYFENNLDANKMEEFCVFLIDQAGETAPLLKQLAQKIRSCIDDLSVVLTWECCYTPKNSI